MICCPRCTHVNPTTIARCQNCNFVCQVAPPSQASLELREGCDFRAPARSFPNAALEALRLSFECFQEGGEDEPIFEALEALRENFECLCESTPATLDAMRELQNLDCDWETPYQVQYFLSRGTQIFESALDELGRYLDQGELPPAEVLESLQEGSDYLAHSAVLTVQMW